ncbi:MAG TPA: Gfo/Idh/MocA family oxidoreductase [Chloroflexota bacterium]|nr:Gfo/Idh/MocA family oxidoreductase [Chloroflexota bacterium]
MADPLRAGVVGLRRGATYARQLAAAPDVELVAVADLDGERVETVCRAHGVARGCSSLEELLEVGLDLVVIATPIPLHAGQSIAALERGVHVLCEVTAVETLDEAEQLVAAVQRSGRRYMMAENACYWGVVDAARALHARGAFGTIFYAEAEYIHALQQRMFDAQGDPTWRARWQDPIIYCTHSLGPLMAITGEYPTEVVCLGSGSHFVPGQQDLQTALVRLTGGGLVRLTVSFTNTHWGHHRYHLLGTRATLDTGWIGQDTPRFRSTDLPHAERPIELPLSTAMPGAPAAARQAGHGGADWFVLRAFLDSLAGGARPPIDVYDALMMTLPGLCAARSAAQGGRPVPIPQYQLRRPSGPRPGAGST